MKKFTLSALAVATILQVGATPKKSVGVINLPQDETKEVVKSSIPAKAQIAKNHSVLSAKVSQALKAASTSRADEATVDDPAAELVQSPNYLYPTGTLFPMLWCYQDQGKDGEEKLVGPVYFTLGNLLLPAGHEVIFPNFSYDSEGNFVKDAKWAWEYETGIYHPQYFSSIMTSDEYNLSAYFAPSPVLNYNMDAPKLTLGDKTFQFGSTYNNEFSAASITFGGNGALNPGDEKINSDKYKLKNLEYSSWITNYANATEVLSYSNAIGAGVSATAYYNGVSCNDLRTNVLKNTLDKYGIDSESFIGFGQLIRTASQRAVLNKISMPTVVAANAGSEITITLYKIEVEGEGDDAHDKYVEITSGIYTIEEKINDLVHVSLDIFDEETGKDYIYLEPDAVYMVVFSDIAGLDAFVPQTPEFSFDAADISQIASADVQNRGDVFALYLYQDAFAPLDVDFNWNVSGGTSTQRKFFPALPIQLHMNYPYITPMAKFITNSTVEAIPSSDNSLEAVFIDMGADYKPMAVTVAFSDMSAEDLTKSLEYSSEDLKSKISVRISGADDYTVPGQTVTFPSSERDIAIIVEDDVPAGSWIRLKNFDQTLTINLPAHEMSGIGDVVADGEAVATEYFDLQGRKVAGEAKGIMIKKMTMADGSVKAVKVVK